MSVRLPDDVVRLLQADPGIDRVELVGSRARGDALPLSDWDFKITTGAFAGCGDACLLSPCGCARGGPVGSAQL
jgi:Nucleotidyltransferase domain